MQSKFELNPFRRTKLLGMLKILFPEYDLIRIKRNGMISFGFKVLCIPIIKQRLHISELCINEIPNRLGKFRKVNVTCYLQNIKEILEYIIVNNSNNVIDYLYQEFSNLKSSNKVDLLLEDAKVNSFESSDSVTINILFKDQVKRNPNVKDIIKHLNRINNETCFLRKVSLVK